MSDLTQRRVISRQPLGLDNPDLRPLAPKERTWTWWNYSAVWMGIVHNLVAWQVAANLIAVGLSFWQAAACVLSAYAIAFAAMLANSVMGAKYGLPFPVLIRAAFGRKGGQIPVALRTFVAVFWFAVHIFIGSQAIGLILSKTIPGYATLGDFHVLGMGGDTLIAFVICWAVHLWVVRHGLGAVKKFEGWAGPSIMVLAIGLVIWASVGAGGFGALFDSPQTVADAQFWPTFVVSLTALIGTVSSLVLNISDLTRQARSQYDQAIGQGIGMPIMFVFFSLMALWVAVGSKEIYGEVITDPIELLGRFENPLVGIFAALCILISTVSVNVATNGVSVGFDMTNLLPKYLTFTRSCLVAIVAAIAFVPWLWYGQTDIVDDILGAIGSLMGPIAGIMLADFYVVRRRNYHVPSLFTEERTGRYDFVNGWNPRALIALVIGAFLALSGLLIPSLAFLYPFNWFIGITSSAVIYVALMLLPRSQSDVVEKRFDDVDYDLAETAPIPTRVKR